MSTQYRDETWSEIEPPEKALETFQEAIDKNVAQRFVVGQNEDGVKQLQRNKDEEIAKLREEFEELKAKTDPTRVIRIPSFDEIKRFGE